MNLEAILAAMNTTYAIVKIMPKIVYTSFLYPQFAYIIFTYFIVS